jgi:hypothetical protein
MNWYVKLIDNSSFDFTKESLSYLKVSRLYLLCLMNEKNDFGKIADFKNRTVSALTVDESLLLATLYSNKGRICAPKQKPLFRFFSLLSA